MNDTARNPAERRSPLELYEGGARPIIALLLFGLWLLGTNWISLSMRGDTPEDVRRELMDISYDLVWQGLSGKIRGEKP